MQYQTDRSLKIVQILPELNSGGVERGTIEFARELVKRGHQSIVISNGGSQVATLEKEGSQHIQLPVHQKSLRSLLRVGKLKRTLEALAPDIIHVRSRIPAWMAWLAWRSMPENTRPGLVSTFHGMYSINPYSAIMGKAEKVIAISDCVERYILDNYDVPKDKITRIFRGLDPEAFNTNACDEQWDEQWKAALYSDYPQLQGKHIILMPGRLTRWKGQEAFIEMMAQLKQIQPNCHGVIVGDAEPNKQHYLQELKALCNEKGVTDHITFMGRRDDIQAFYGLASVTCHMSNKAEPFGRTVPEALATGCPVVAFDRGGASESLNAGFPQGLVEPDNIQMFSRRVAELIEATNLDISLPKDFYLESQVEATLKVYYSLLSEKH